MNVVYEEIRMSEKNIVLIPGDGIGTEIIAAAKAVKLAGALGLSLASDECSI